jgi:putative ABC transport system ATP-binding protein
VSPPAGRDTLVELTGLVRLRERGASAFRLRVPSLRVHAGEFVALVGDSGSGKSTLLDMLALVLRPSEAGAFRIRAGARDTDVMALWRAGREGALARIRREHLGYVLQTGGLLPFLSVRGNLELPLRMNGRRDDGAVAAAARRMGIADHLDSRPDRLSGGERQRVAVLRALLHRPALVLADEPTAAVDKSRARAIVADFHAAARALGTAIVMVTHDLDLVRPVADTTYRCTLGTATPGLVEAVCECA